jgi:resolvase-like protein/recombinase
VLLQTTMNRVRGLHVGCAHWWPTARRRPARSAASEPLTSFRVCLGFRFLVRLFRRFHSGISGTGTALSRHSCALSRKRSRYHSGAKCLSGYCGIQQTEVPRKSPRRFRPNNVYEVDRLTRSLADFAKLVELFDEHGVSFVSVTQQFNTTTSMGRLTLNVLLSFAQFEREVTSERIRDKIAASKRKGLWVGGMAPLGYDTRDSRIVVVEEEAERVRTIFRSYLALGSLNRLLADLRQKGIVTKVRTLKTSHMVGGIPFTRGPLAYLLRNRFYIGVPVAN